MSTQNKIPQIPEGYTEEEVVNLLTKIAKRLASRFRFGYHAIEDMKQQAILEGWKGLLNYDGVRPLENFLWIHIRNRLFNYKRDNYQRVEYRCNSCPIKQYDKKNNLCLKHEQDSLEDCKWYYDWVLRNNAKKNLVDTIDFDNVDDDGEAFMSLTVDFAENADKSMIFEILEREIPMSHYEDYVRLKCGAKISHPRKRAIKEMIIEILQEHNYI